MTNKIDMAKYWSTEAREYSDIVNRELISADKADWLRMVFDKLPKHRKLDILDIGTGPGFFTISFTKFGHNATGIDITPEMIEVAKENAAREGVFPTFRLMNCNKLDFPDESFDLVISRNVSWTLPDAFSCYEEWRRVLKPNGKLIIIDGTWGDREFFESNAMVHHRAARKWVLENYRTGIERRIIERKVDITMPTMGELPMRNGVRPEWDRNMLSKLMYINIEVDKDITLASRMDTGSHFNYVGTFMITAEKPNKEQEFDLLSKCLWESLEPCYELICEDTMKDGTFIAYVDMISEYIDKDDRVLEIGAGTGDLLVPMTKAGMDITGLDFAWPMKENAEFNAISRGFCVDYELGDIKAMPFGDRKFDAVLCRNTLWSVCNKEKAVSEIKRVLKKGGKLIITDSEWFKKVDAWKKANPGKEEQTTLTFRDFGFGGIEPLDTAYRNMGLKKECTKAFTKKLLTSAGFRITVEKEFQDPVLSEEDRKVFGKQYLIVAEKQ